MKKFDSFFIGLMLFSMFFGAGNLIFPPYLGALSGTSFWLAITGFILTAVGLPFIVLLSISMAKGGIEAIASRVHPLFGTLFMVIIYLSIGPFLAIPRNAGVAFEMGVMPFINDSWNLSLILFTYSAVFFLLVYVVSLNPAKMERFMGRWLTPVLLLSVVILCTAAIMNFGTKQLAPSGGYDSGAFFKGFLEGYNTMDALAALAFGIVILTAIQKKGVHDEKQLSLYTLRAAVIAGVLLAAVYISLGLLGAKIAANGTFENGTAILSSAATLLFGRAGTAFIGAIFTLACFTTVVGLTSACGQYFSKLLPKVSYKLVISAVTLIGFTLSNLGLNQILKVSVPFLVTAYPLTIVLITLSFFNGFFRNPRKVYGSALLFTGVFAALGALSTFGFDLGALQSLREVLPFASVGMEWVVPAAAGTALGILLSKTDRQQPDSAKQMDVKAS